MPNTPLQTFRAVEPANYGFGAAATLASRPFVLNHCTYTFTGAGSAVTTQAVTFNAATADANRFIPWLARNFDNPATTGSYYPVRVPQAYDRIYVFPMYRTSTDDTQVNANAVTLTQSSYDAPRVFPMGLFPETRDYTTSNPNNPLNAVIPEDVIRKGYPTHVSNADYNTRTHGIWSPLPPYASNFSTSNGELAVGGTNNPVSFGRTGVGTGTAYALPDDLTISKAGSSQLLLNNAFFVGGNAAYIGMGHEYQTMGCEEIVLSIGAIPSNLQLAAPGTNGKVYVVHWFMMGVLLG
jgi:hypothetical protein